MSHGHDGHDHAPPSSAAAGADAAAAQSQEQVQEQRLSEAMKERQQVLRRLKTATLLCTIFFVVEIVGGLLASSLAILSDAAHLFSDFASFAVAIFANYLASMPSTEFHTYGLKRTESLAALFSMVSLAMVCVWLGVEAIRRFYYILYQPDLVEQVDGKLMSGIAVIGVLVNVALAFVLGEHHVHMPGASHDHSHDHDHGEDDSGHDHGHSHGHNKDEEKGHNGDDGHAHSHDHGSSCKKEDKSHDHDHEHGVAATESSCLLSKDENGRITPEHTNEVAPPCSSKKTKKRNVNLQAAYLHVLGDLAQSVAVLIAGMLIWYKPEWMIVDPIITLAFCVLVFHSTLGVLRSSVAVLLEEVPPKISYMDVYNDLNKLTNVEKVHHLHIWSISHGEPCVSLHASAVHDDCGVALKEIFAVCKKHGITHITAQVQPNSIGDCITCENSPHEDCY